MGADALIRYPFSAVVGQERLKLALILSAIAPGIGGVLVRGEKGTAKTTVVRGLGPLLPAAGERPRVVELPIGATEDRVIGSLDLTRVLRDGEAVFTPGLLAQADGGVLYIDEVNLLADHLVDVLLDAAASGRVTIERDGVSHTQDASFVLVGTMNPEEGELRPQLLDRFGLAVDVAAPTDVEQRVAVVERRMAFDADPAGFVAGFADEEQLLAERIAAARDRVNGILLPAAQLRRIAGICAHLQVDGLRGDLVVARAAAAHAAWRGAEEVDEDDIAVAVELALPHRRRRDPFDNGSLDDEALSDAMAAGDEAAGEPDPEPDPDGGPGSGASADRDTSDDGGFDGGAPDSTGTPATDDSQAGVDARRFGTDSTSKPAPVRLLGSAAPAVPILSFTVDGVSPIELASALDLEGIAVQAGNHCAQPLLEHAALRFWPRKDHHQIVSFAEIFFGKPTQRAEVFDGEVGFFDMAEFAGKVGFFFPIGHPTFIEFSHGLLVQPT